MTVLSTTNRVTYVGNGALTVYPYTFKLFLAADIAVYVGGVLKTLDADYTVSGVGTPSGNVTFTVAPADGASVILLRALPATQESAYPSNDNFPAVVHENALDKLTMLVQRIDEEVGRAPRLDVTSPLLDIAFPSPGAGKFIRWDAVGLALEAIDILTLIPDPGTYLGVTLHVPGEAPASPVSKGIVGIGAAPADGLILNIAGTINSQGSATGVNLHPTLKPDVDGTPGNIDGDVDGIKIAPIVHINPLAIPGGNNTQKWVVSARIKLPDLVLTNPDPVTGAGLPQEVIGIKIDDSGLTQSDSHRGVWAIHEIGGLPNRLGALLLKTTGNRLDNIRPDNNDWFANIIRLDATLEPLSDAAKNPGRSAWAIHSEVHIQSDVSGQHDDLGNAYILTPTYTNNGVTTVPRATTLRVGNAPATTIGAVTVGTVRALWVGTGRSHFEGDVLIGDVLRLGGTLVDSGVTAGDIVLPNSTGRIVCVDSAGTGTKDSLKCDTSNRLVLGAGFVEVVVGSAGAGGTYLRFNEITEPGNSSTNQGRVFAKDNGAGKTQLCVRFNTGATVVIATEP